MKKNNTKYIVIILSVIIAAAIFFYTYCIYFSQRQPETPDVRQEQLEMLQQQQEIRAQRLEQLAKEKEENAAEIIDFHRQYEGMTDEFTAEVNRISEEADSKINNLDQIKELTADRIKASRKFKASFEGMHIPSPLSYFYECQIAFLDNDLETWLLTNAYYDSGSYSTYDVQELDLKHKQNGRLLREARTELLRIYSKYELEDLLN